MEPTYDVKESMAAEREEGAASAASYSPSETGLDKVDTRRTKRGTTYSKTVGS